MSKRFIVAIMIFIRFLYEIHNAKFSYLSTNTDRKNKVYPNIRANIETLKCNVGGFYELFFKKRQV